MRIVFLAASKFGLRCLAAVESLPDCDVVGAVTAPAHFSISYRPAGVTNVLHAEVGKFCAAHGIPCTEMGPDAMRSAELLAQVESWKPDIFVVAGWYHIVPNAWLEVAPAYGLHASLLPKYRGGAPLVWAIINGERSTGITLFRFDGGVDTGPIVAQAPTPIRPDDTIATLYERIEVLGESLLVGALPLLGSGKARHEPQPHGGDSVNAWPQRSPADGRIDWSWPAGRIVNFIRAQTKPYPGAFFETDGRKVTVWGARNCDRGPSVLQPGEIRESEGRVVVGAGDSGAVELLSVAENDSDLEPLQWLAGRGARRTENSRKYHFEDFTLANYRKLVELAKGKYLFRTYADSKPGETYVLWRHDLDFSVLDALPLAEIEAEAGVAATYFVNLRDRSYNALDAVNRAALRRVLGLGHRIGVHFDFSHHSPSSKQELCTALRAEAAILQQEFGGPVEAFSFHNPDEAALAYRDETYGGLLNAYSSSFRTDVAYCSDSNGYWRHDRLVDVLSRDAVRPLQVLTHPCWWTAEVMSPRQKIERAVSAPAGAILAEYESALAAAGRFDIDW